MGEERIVYELPENQGMPDTPKALLADWKKTEKEMRRALVLARKAFGRGDYDSFAGCILTITRAADECIDFANGYLPIG